MRTTRTTGALGLLAVLILTGCAAGDGTGTPVPSPAGASTDTLAGPAPAPDPTAPEGVPSGGPSPEPQPSPAPAAEPSASPRPRPTPSASPSRPATAPPARPPAQPSPARPAPAPTAPVPAPVPSPLQPLPEPEPTPAPSPAPAPPAPGPLWPTAVPEPVAIRGEVAGITVVWVAVEAGPYASDLDAAAARVEAAGYEGPHTPLTCQAAAWESLGVPGGRLEAGYVFGVPVYFADAADAAAFVDLWEGPVAAVVQGEVFCHFD